MKKTIHVNLGGSPWIMDDDAYDQLEEYLKQTEVQWDESERQEQLLKVEIRISNLFRQRLSSTSQVVDLPLVKHAIGVMGTPAPLEETHHSEPSHTAQSETTPKEEGIKKLYLSRKDQIVGGVCGGIAEYFEIDSTLVRILTAILLFTGVGIAVYLILWIITPLTPKSQPESLEHRKIYRSRKDRILGGVCGGFAKYLNVDPTIVRLITFFLIGPFYFLFWLIIPREPAQE